MTILDAIQYWANVAPEHKAHVSGHRTLTYGELAHRSDILAAYLLRTYPATRMPDASDARRPIAIYGHKEPEMLIGFLAAVKCGHPYIPIDVGIPQQRVESILSASRAQVLLSASDIARLTEKAESVKVDPIHHVMEDDLFYLMFTSGSTGQPKGVGITCRNVESFVDWMVREQDFTPQGEVFLDQAPFSFDLSIMDVYPCLVTGNTLFSLGKDDIANPAQLFRSLSGSQVTVWVSTPSFTALCLTEKTFSQTMLPKLGRFLLCGETLSVEVAAALLSRFPNAEVWNTYGPTETTVATTSIEIDEQNVRRYSALPVGYPKPGSRILVVDDDDKPVADGERGHIIIAGENVSPGYVDRPEMTAKVFFDLDSTDGQSRIRAYRTGDHGYLRDGLLFFDGRQDSQIKLHGHRIELGDIEANIQSLAHVRDAIVVVKMKDTVPDSLSAFVIYDDGEEKVVSEADRVRRLRAQLAQRLPSYMIPRRFYFLTTFPLTVNGKADRKKLAESQP